MIVGANILLFILLCKYIWRYEMRKKLAAGNWKMNMTASEAKALCEKLVPLVKSNDTDVLFCVPYIDIPIVSECIKGTNIMLGAQNFYFEDKGAYTGEISADMLKCYNVSYVIIGHSERRQIFKEDNAMINKKVLKAIEKDIIPVLCCGETLEQRENNETLDFIKSQIISALNGVDKKDVTKIIIAYEPIWAIGTGKTATDDQAEEVCAYIRKIIKELYSDEEANNIRILYGGSVNGKNAKSLFDKQNIDGGLVGGASLKEEFGDIVNRK